MLRYTLTEQLIHGMEVSNLAYDLARELGYEKEICYELAKAGVLHALCGPIPHWDMSCCRDADTPILCWRAFCTTMKIMTEQDILRIWQEKRFRLGRVFCVSAMCTAH